MRFGAVDLTIDQFFPHTVGGAEFAAQMPHHVADGILAVAHTNVVDIRIGHGLLLGQHGLIAADQNRNRGHQPLDLREVRLHRIPVGTHDGKGDQVGIERLHRAGEIHRRVALGVAQDEYRLKQDFDIRKFALEIGGHAGDGHRDFVAVRRIERKRQPQLLPGDSSEITGFFPGIDRLAAADGDHWSLGIHEVTQPRDAGKYSINARYNPRLNLPGAKFTLSRDAPHSRSRPMAGFPASSE